MRHLVQSAAKYVNQKCFKIFQNKSNLTFQTRTTSLERCDTDKIGNKIIYRNLTTQSESAMAETQQSVYSNVVNDIVANIPEFDKYYTEILSHNVFPGDRTILKTTVEAYRMLEKPEHHTPENIKLVTILGWCAEILKSSFQLFEDVANNSQTRNELPCWHQMENVGLSAINDGAVMEESLYVVLAKHFKNHHCYLPVMELFHDVTTQTALGQIFENTLISEGKPQLQLYTSKNFDYLTSGKTTNHRFYLPIGLAMYMSSMNDAQLHFQVREVLREVGRFYHMQRNYSNCFGEPTEEEGNDIANGKCTWFAVSALERANPLQRDIMEKYYGNGNSEGIRKLYHELKLCDLYNGDRQESLKRVQLLTDDVSQEGVRKLLRSVAARVYNYKFSSNS